MGSASGDSENKKITLDPHSARGRTVKNILTFPLSQNCHFQLDNDVSKIETSDNSYHSWFFSIYQLEVIVSPKKKAVAIPGCISIIASFYNTGLPTFFFSTKSKSRPGVATSKLQPLSITRSW